MSDELHVLCRGYQSLCSGLLSRSFGFMLADHHGRVCVSGLMRWCHIRRHHALTEVLRSSRSGLCSQSFLFWRYFAETHAQVCLFRLAHIEVRVADCPRRGSCSRFCSRNLAPVPCRINFVLRRRRLQPRQQIKCF